MTSLEGSASPAGACQVMDGGVSPCRPVEPSCAGLPGPPLPERQGLSSDVCMHVLNKTLFDLDLGLRRENNP